MRDTRKVPEVHVDTDPRVIGRTDIPWALPPKLSLYTVKVEEDFYVFVLRARVEENRIVETKWSGDDPLDANKEYEFDAAVGRLKRAWEKYREENIG